MTSGGEAHRRGRIAGWLAVAALLVALWGHAEALTRAYSVNNDAHQHTFWLPWLAEEASNTGAIESDLLALYASRYEPQLWVAAYRALSPLVAPIWLGRLLPLLLFPLSALLLFWVTDRMDDRRQEFPWPAVIAVGLLLVSPFFLRKMAGGHPRAFATPFLLATLYLLQRRKVAPQAALLVVQALTYPISWLLSAATVASQWVYFERWRPRLRRWSSILPLAAAIAVGGLALGSRYLRPSEPRLGAIATRAQLSEGSPLRRQLERGGRTADLPIPSLLGGYEKLVRGDLFRLRAVGSASWPDGWPRRLDRRLYFCLLLALAVYAYLVARHRMPWPPELAGLILASCALYFTADRLLLRLLLPQRYIMYSLGLATLIVLALLSGRAIAALPRFGRRLAACGLIVLGLLLIPGNRGFGIDDYSPWSEAYELARALPAEGLIAASPRTADGIALFTGRHVLINYQMALPYLPTYWQSVEERLDDLFAAYYATDLAPLATLHRRHGVDTLIVDRTDFEPTGNPERPAIIFEPWRSQIERRLAAKAPFYLLRLPPRLRGPASPSGRFFAVDLERLLVAQSVDGIEGGGAHRRVDPGNQPDADRDAGR